MKNNGGAPRRARWLAALCVFACFASPEGASAEESETVNTCLGFRNEVGDKQLVVHASNACEKRWACSLRYTVECTDHEQKVTARVEKRATFALLAKGAQDILLSAAQCKQGWSIDELTWSCN